MSGITYDGVPGLSQNGIFKDVKFWVATRVPSRARYLSDIESNGGLHVLLEKSADILIADHMRKDAPPKAITYKFIEDSIKNGVMQLPDRYIIAHEPEPRPVGAGIRGKNTRNPFTPAEDAILAKWVLRHSKHRTGNEIYRDLEPLYPSHTWQSWRNRFMKTLLSFSDAHLRKLADLAPEDAFDHIKKPTVQATRQGQSSSPVARQPKKEQPKQERREPAKQVVPAPKQRAKTPLLTPLPEPEAKPGPVQRSEETPSQAPSEGSTTMRDQFYADLQAFCTANEIDLNIRPKIGGIQLDLFDLLAAVGDQDHDQIDWKVVAQKLELEQDVRTMRKLGSCWDMYLADFLEEMAKFGEGSQAETEDEEEFEEEEEEEEEEEITLLAPQNDGGLRSDIPSSPPQTQSRKRSLQSNELTPSSGERNKRRRLDRNAEIPSTPEEDLGMRRSVRVSSPSTRQSNERSALRINHQTPMRKQPSREESSFDISPSQQLSFEALASSQHEAEEQEPEESIEAIEEQEDLEATPRASNNDSRRSPRNHISPTRPLPQARKRSLPSTFTAAPRALHPTKSTVAATYTSKPIHRSSPKPKPTTLSHTPSSNTPKSPETFQDWLSHYQSLTYPLPIVLTALRATTLTPGRHAAETMQSLIEGKGIPSHMEGVWTSRDDKGLCTIRDVGGKEGLRRQAKHADDFELLKGARREEIRLVKKHGRERMEMRGEFLKAAAEEEEGRKAQDAAAAR